MKKNSKAKIKKRYITGALSAAVFILFFSLFYGISKNSLFLVQAESMSTSTISTLSLPDMPKVPELDVILYDKKLQELANNPVIVVATSTRASSTLASSASVLSGSTTSATSTPKVKYLWPVKTVYPNVGALLPFNRIVAYYGNFYSTKMGVLGEYPEATMLSMLKAEVEKWKLADPGTPVIPAIHYIAVTAQGSAGVDGKYRLRMPDTQIQKALDIAAKINGLVFLDIQVAQSNLQSEIPALEKFLKLPNVHLGIDPEFSMKTGKKPGTIIGTMSAADVNFAAQYLAKLVKDNNLPPKILVVHRFTQGMVTGSSLITPLPEVQIVIDMDGWGAASNKKRAYHDFVYAEPVQFTGLKLFYKNDLRKPSTGMLTTGEVMNLRPRPSYIQYQ